MGLDWSFQMIRLIGGIAVLGLIGVWALSRKNDVPVNAQSNQSSDSTSNLLVSGENIFAGALQETSLMIKSLNNPGVRNNNPLNIIWTENSRKNPWVGQVGEAGRFLVFSSPEYGFRAAAKLLRNYFASGANTIWKVCHKWAPKEDGNNPEKYAEFVSKQTGINVNRVLGQADVPIILRAMSKMETGKDWPMDVILHGVSLSLKT